MWVSSGCLGRRGFGFRHGFVFTHGLAFEGKPIGVVHEAIQDGAGEGGPVEIGMPLIRQVSLESKFQA